MSTRKDLLPSDIRAELNRKQYQFSDVDRVFDLPTNTANRAARYPHEEGEAAIADVLGVEPYKIWPSRYDPKTGLRLKPQPSSNYNPAPQFCTRQKRHAA